MSTTASVIPTPTPIRPACSPVMATPAVPATVPILYLATSIDVDAALNLHAPPITLQAREIEKTSIEMNRLTDGMEAFLPPLGKVKTETVATEKATRAHAEAVAAMVAKLGGDEAINAAKLWMEALPKIGGLSKLTEADHKALVKVLDEALAAYDRAGKQAPAAMIQLAEAAKLPLESTNLLVNTLGIGPTSLVGVTTDLAENILPSFIAEIQLGTQTVDGFGRVVSTQVAPSLGTMGDAAHQAALRMGEIDESTHQLAKDLQTLAGAFQGLAQVSGGSMAEVSRHIGVIFKSTDVFKAGLADIGKGNAVSA